MPYYSIGAELLIVYHVQHSEPTLVFISYKVLEKINLHGVKFTLTHGFKGYISIILSLVAGQSMEAMNT